MFENISISDYAFLRAIYSYKGDCAQGNLQCQDCPLKLGREKCKIDTPQNINPPAYASVTGQRNISIGIGNHNPDTTRYKECVNIKLRYRIALEILTTNEHIQDCLTEEAL